MLSVKIDTCLKRHAQSVDDDDESGDAHATLGSTFPSSSRKPSAAGLLARNNGRARIATDSAIKPDAVIMVRAFFVRKVD